jgi:hypothetical protein
MSEIDLNLEGENLYRQFLSAIADQNWSAVEAMISPSFQSVHSDGTRDRIAELALIKCIDLGTYTLHDFKVTKANSHLVVTCWISIEETIDGERLSTKSSPRLSVWDKTPNGWQLIALANLNPV